MGELEPEQEQIRAEVAESGGELADGLEHKRTTSVGGERSGTHDPPEQLGSRAVTEAASAWPGEDDGRSSVLESGCEAAEVESDGELAIVARVPGPVIATEVLSRHREKQPEP